MVKRPRRAAARAHTQVDPTPRPTPFQRVQLVVSDLREPGTPKTGGGWTLDPGIKVLDLTFEDWHTARELWRTVQRDGYYHGGAEPKTGTWYPPSAIRRIDFLGGVTS
jgi:hypothetical protein